MCEVIHTVVEIIKNEAQEIAVLMGLSANSYAISANDE